jgi:hypothetical protein
MKIRRNQAEGGANESHFINKKLTPSAKWMNGRHMTKIEPFTILLL